MTGGVVSLVGVVGVGPFVIPTPGDVVTALKDAVVDVADTMFTKIMEWIAGLLADTVAKTTEALVSLLRTVKPSLTPGGVIVDASTVQSSVAGLSAALLVVFFLFRICHGVITGQAGQSIRATIVDLPIIVVGTLFFGFLCYSLLSVVDAFSDPMIDEFASTLNDSVTNLYSKEGMAKGGLFVLIFAVLYIVAGIFLCIELFVRSSLIYLVIVFAPLALATRVWGPMRNYARKATETAVALIFSKLAIAVTLATGASLLNGAAAPGSTSGSVQMIQGSAVVLLAAFMPFGLMRVIPMMEGAVAGEGVARTMTAKTVGAAYTARKAGGAMSTVASAATSPIRSAWESRSAGGSGASAGSVPGSQFAGRSSSSTGQSSSGASPALGANPARSSGSSGASSSGSAPTAVPASSPSQNPSGTNSAHQSPSQSKGTRPTGSHGRGSGNGGQGQAQGPGPSTGDSKKSTDEGRRTW